MNWLRHGKAQKPMDLLDDAKDKGQLDDNDYKATYDRVMDRARTTGAQILADKLHKEGVSYEDSQDRIDKAAEDFSKGNDAERVLFKKSAESALGQQKLVGDRIIRDELNQNRTTIWSAIAKGDITTKQQVLANPDLNKAYQGSDTQRTKRF